MYEWLKFNCEIRNGFVSIENVVDAILNNLSDHYSIIDKIEQMEDDKED
jgi:hypothetical protein